MSRTVKITGFNEYPETVAEHTTPLGTFAVPLRNFDFTVTFTVDGADAVLDDLHAQLSKLGEPEEGQEPSVEYRDVQEEIAKYHCLRDIQQSLDAAHLHQHRDLYGLKSDEEATESILRDLIVSWDPDETRASVKVEWARE